MKLKIILISLVIFTGLFLNAFGSPAAPQNIKLQDTVVPPGLTPAVTVVAPTLAVETAVTTPGVVPVTGEPDPTIWMIILFGLLGLLAIAFLVALFSPRPTRSDIDRHGPPPPEI